MTVAKDLSLLSDACRQYAESVSRDIADKKNDPRSMCFWNIHNRMRISEEIMTFYERQWGSDDFPEVDEDTEAELVEKLCVSRNTVREAIKTLVAFGVLEIKRADGTYICEGITKQMLNPLVYGIIFSQNDSYRQLKEFRQMVEVASLYLAIRYKTPEKLEKLQERYDTLIELYGKSHSSLEEIMTADMEFHLEISRMADNKILLEVCNLLMTLTASKRTEVTKMLLETDMPYLYENHKGFLDAVVNGTPETTLDDLIKVCRPDYYGD